MIVRLSNIVIFQVPYSGRPNEFRSLVLVKMHNISHPNARAITKLIQKRFVWPHLRKDWRVFVKNCVLYQKTKIQRHTKTPVHHYEPEDTCFAHIKIFLNEE